ASAPHHSKVTAARTRHHLKNGAGFAVFPRAEDDSFVAPFHCSILNFPGHFATGGNALRSAIRRALVRELQSHLAIALRVVAPVLANLHEQEQVHGLLEDFADLPASGLPDRADCLALVAKNDLFLAVALDIDHLLYAHRPVRLFFPTLG